MIRRSAVAALATVGLAGLALAACTSAPASTPPTAAPTTASPTETLTAALGKLKGQSYDVALTQQGGDTTGKGSVNAATTSASMQQGGTVEGQTVNVAAVQVGTSLWVKIDLGAATDAQAGIDPSKWMLVDPTKATGPKAKTFDLTGSDAFDLAGLLTSTAGVTATGSMLSGTVDLTAATGVSGPDSSTLKAAGTAAKAVPFTATVDSQGRLTDLKVTAPANKALDEEFVFSNYGSPSAIDTPAAADVIPATAVVYQILNTN